MSNGICRAQKLSGASGGVGAYIHNERIKDHSNSNPDIDFGKSAENYHIRHYDNALSYNQRAEKRILQGYKGKKAVRKDAVRIVEMLFTSDKAFFDSQPDNGMAYFEDCLKWASERFGEDNIIADTVHLDEATPHMHLDFVPLTEDGRLSAKAVLGDKKQLQGLQDDFYEKVSSKYGLDRGNRADLDAGESGRKNLSTAEYKEKMLEEKIHQRELELDSLSKRSARLKKDISGLRTDKISLQEKITVLEAKKDVLDSDSQVLMMKFIEHPKINSLFSEYCRAERNKVQERPEHRKSIKASLSRYQEEAKKESPQIEKERNKDTKSR